MTEIIIIVLTAIILVLLLVKDYEKGLHVAIYALLVLPRTISIDISESFPSITIHRVIILTLLVAWWGNSKIKKDINGIPYVGIFIILSLSHLVSMFLSHELVISLKRYLYFLIEYVALYIIMTTSMREEKEVNSIIRVVIAALATVAFLGVVERYTGINVADLFGRGKFASVEVLRASSSEVRVSYTDRILYGAAMAVGLMSSIIYIKRQEKLSFLFHACLFGAALYFSFSRGPWLAFILTGMLVIVLRRGFVAKRMLSIFLLASLMLVIRPGTFATIQELYTDTFNPESIKGSSYNWRYQVMNAAYKKVSNSDSIMNFLFGYGQGSHIFMEFPEVQLTTGRYAKLLSWDNEFAVVLLEHGFVGFLVLSWLYLLVLKRGIIQCIHAKKNKDILLLSLSSLFIIIFMKTNVKIFTPQLVYIESIFLSTLVVGIRQERESRVHQPIVASLRYKAV